MSSAKRPRVVLCNRAAKSSISTRKTDPDPLVLDYRNDGRIRLRLQDFVRSVGTVPGRVLDLVELAGYIFAADRLTARGQPDALVLDSWSRRFHFVVKIRDFEFWNDESTQQRLSSLLCFITGDREYRFTFQPGHTTDPAHLFDSEEFRTTPDKPHHVMLFSGGLDSLAGAVERLNASNDVVCLVSHRSGQPSTAMTQDRLAESLARRFVGRVKPYRFSTGLASKRAISETQRTRTMLYGSIAFALASALDQREVSFYENGVTSLNFARRQDLLNARASRTTHPRTMHLLEDLFTHLAEKPVRIQNAYRWKTKGDVLEILKSYDAESLIPSAVTCSRTAMTRGEHTHCGGCFQCVDRRFAAAAVGLSDVDYSGLYTLDMLSERIEDGEIRTVILDYIRLGLDLEADTLDSFYSKWLTEIAEAITPGDTEEELVRALYGLMHGFGKQIVTALREFSSRADLKTRPPAGSLMHMIRQQHYLLTDTDRFVGRLTERLARALPTMFANNLPLNENDLNDKIEGLLQAESLDYRREFPATQFAMARVVPDHEFAKWQVLIESKYARATTHVSRITDEIASDMVKYPASAYIVFVIFDRDRVIKDDVRFAEGIELQRRCKVLVLR